MSKKSRDNRPHLRPVTRVELSQSNIKLRWILIAVLLIIAIVAFAVGFNEVLRTEPGWQAVESISNEPNSSTEFMLMYDYSDYGSGATQLNKSLVAFYSEISEEAFRIFSPDIQEEGLYNVNYVNASVNKEITVDPSLYRAFELLNEYENRSIFLAPVYVEYDRVFRSESDPEAMSFDPAKNPEVMSYITEVVRYTSDPQMVSIDLLGQNRMKLNISQEYLSFAEEYGIEEFIDFGWMRNAFIADYLADRLVSNGYTNGYLASFDGFTRNLDSADQTFRMNLFDMQGTKVYMPATMEYPGGTSVVFLRSYPLDDLDRWRSYVYADGGIVTSIIDPADGISKFALNNMVSYGRNLGCAEILLRMIPVYLADEFSDEAANELAGEGIFSIWCQDGTLYHNDADLKLELLVDTEGYSYEKALSK